MSLDADSLELEGDCEEGEVDDGGCADGDVEDGDDAPCAATSADAMNRLATDPMSIFFIACSPWTVPGTRRP
jgi:hypothetical protein